MSNLTPTLSLDRMALGAIFRFPDLIDAYALTESSFVEADTKRLFRAISCAEHSASGCDPDVVATLAGISSAEVMSLPIAPTMEAARRRLEKLEQKLLHDALTREITSLFSETRKGDEPGRSLMGGIETIVQKYRSIDTRSTLPSIGQAVREMCRDRLTTPEDTTRYKTGIPGIDRLLAGGICPGELVVIGARPGIGKTTIAMQLALQWIAEGRRGVYFSAEMSTTSLAERVAHMLVRRPVHAGQLSPTELQIAHDTVTEDMERLKVCDSSGIHIEAVRRSLYNEIQRGAGFFIIDNLNQVGDRSENDVVRLANGIIDLRAIAKEWRVPGIVLHHLSRRAEYAEDSEGTRESPQPSTAWLKGSGGIEEQADIVLFMEAEPVAAELMGANLSPAGIWVMKSRRTGFRNVKIPCVFKKATQTYVEEYSHGPN